MSTAPENSYLDWQGVRLEIRYVADYSPVYRARFGYALAHLDLRAIEPAQAPLPVTETGYRSLFTRADLVDAEGGPSGFVQAWLDHEALSPSWIASRASHRQLSLL